MGDERGDDIISHPLASDTIELGEDVRVITLRQEQSSHVVVHGGRSVLVDCHTPHIRRWISHRGLPIPELILHTHVQPEHCREGQSFPKAKILVPRNLAALASDPEQYRRDARTVWENPADWPTTMGREPYGIAGSITMLPPSDPLDLGGTFEPGDTLDWLDLTFHVIALPGHGPHSVGFLLRKDDRPLGFFIGDLFRGPARLTNLYDLETSYGGTELRALPDLLRSTASIGTDVFFPATGPALPDGPAQARALAAKIDDYHRALAWTSGLFQPEPPGAHPLVGRYARLHEGVYQITNAGNCVLFIDRCGRGLLVDPGPCDFESPSRKDAFLEDLMVFEDQCGLKSIELALITHMHGDHYDMVPALRERFPRCRVAAWDLVARVVEAPWDYPYAALLPWYDAGFEHVHVDDVLFRCAPYGWNDVRIESDHLPGHCNAHAVYFLTFNGLRIAITGDTIQSRGEADALNFILANDSVPDEAGCRRACETMLKHDVDLNIGGHGSHFTNCRAVYEESLRRIEHAMPFLKALVPRGDLGAACRRPWFPHLDPLEAGSP